MSDMDETQQQPATTPTPEPSGAAAPVPASRPWYRRTGALVGGGIVAGVLLVAIGGAAGVAISQATDHRHGDDIGLSADAQFDPGHGGRDRGGDRGGAQSGPGMPQQPGGDQWRGDGPGRDGHHDRGFGDRDRDGDGHGPWGGFGDGPGGGGPQQGFGDGGGAGQAPAMPSAPQG